MDKIYKFKQDISLKQGNYHSFVMFRKSFRSQKRLWQLSEDDEG